MFRIVENLVSSVLAEEVEIRYNCEVNEIITAGNKVEGLRLHNGEVVPDADLVVANADLPYAYSRLLPGDSFNQKLKRMKYACSAVTFYWALDKIYTEIEQHNVFVSDEYRVNIGKVFSGNNNIPDDFSFYVMSSAKNDPTSAPAGCDSWTIIVPVAHLDEDDQKDPELLKAKTRQVIISRLKRMGLVDIEQHIRFEMCFTPENWEKHLNLARGSVFGSLSHDLFQMGYMRPHNRHRKYKNLYFVGGSTHPGNGIPMVLISEQLVAQRIQKEFSLSNS